MFSRYLFILLIPIMDLTYFPYFSAFLLVTLGVVYLVWKSHRRSIGKGDVNVLEPFLQVPEIRSFAFRLGASLGLGAYIGTAIFLSILVSGSDRFMQMTGAYFFATFFMAVALFYALGVHGEFGFGKTLYKRTALMSLALSILWFMLSYGAYERSCQGEECFTLFFSYVFFPFIYFGIYIGTIVLVHILSWKSLLRYVIGSALFVLAIPVLILAGNWHQKCDREPLHRTSCLRGVAMEKGDPEYCTYLIGWEREVRCFEDVAERTLEPSACREYLQGREKDDCFWHIASETANLPLCTEIASDEKRDWCRTKFNPERYAVDGPLSVFPSEVLPLYRSFAWSAPRRDTRGGLGGSPNSQSFSGYSISAPASTLTSEDIAAFRSHYDRVLVQAGWAEDLSYPERHEVPRGSIWAYRKGDSEILIFTETTSKYPFEGSFVKIFSGK